MDKLTEKQWLKRKDLNIHKTFKQYQDFPAFSNIEFNLIAACTRRCVFCPVSNPKYYELLYGDIRPKHITTDLYLKAIEDLKDIEYSGVISYSGFGEPLLHPKLELLISLTKQHLISVRVVIISNGDLLNNSKIKGLFDAGLDEIVVSLYDGKAQLDKLRHIVKISGVPEEKVFFRRRYFNGRNYGFSISNRCGLVNIKSFDKIEVSIPLGKKCYYPFNFIKIDLNGDVLYCPHNWKKLNIPGNVTRNSIWEIWRSKKLENIRHKLSQADREFLPCSLCDVEGTKSGKEGYVAWENIQNI